MVVSNHHTTTRSFGCRIRVVSHKEVGVSGQPKGYIRKVGLQGRREPDKMLMVVLLEYVR